MPDKIEFIAGRAGPAKRWRFSARHKPAVGTNLQPQLFAQSFALLQALEEFIENADNDGDYNEAWSLAHRSGPSVLYLVFGVRLQKAKAANFNSLVPKS